MRESGYYFVKFFDEGEWGIGYVLKYTNCNDYYWTIVGSDEMFHDYDFTQIGPKIELPIGLD